MCDLSILMVYEDAAFGYLWLINFFVKLKRQWLFCHQQHFTVGGYFAMRHLCLVNFNDIFIMWIDHFWAVKFNDQLKKICTSSLHSLPVYTTLHIHIPGLSTVHSFVAVPCQPRFHPITIVFWDGCIVLAPQCHCQNCSNYGYLGTHKSCEWWQQNSLWE